ncbi:MAG: SCP2 sterol-binding domain-containing protein [Micavibrio aeruginosavorus]|uniref:SCP2 sterol-binding domain-containing protein n=1 Tax=Micavibrio aeruginosavorus TaxID=349221 RepID=A0A7T5R2R3_9BACT|nr:MAG: SCP2 sterol-binding domain-containing protein [Micavibrio aeruginosavorus]
MSLETVTEKIRSKMARATGLSARVKFNFGDEGRLLVDSTQSPAVLSHDDADADVTFECTIDTFEAILEGRQDPSLAFMMGKLKVRGSMGLAMKLNAILED